MRYLRLLMAFGVLFTLLAGQCPDECEYEPNLFYSINLQVSDNDNELLATDTLWLEADFDTHVVFDNGLDGDLGDASCQLNVRVFRLAEPSVPTTGQDFEFVVADSSSFVRDVAAEEPGETYGTVSFICTDDRCQFRVGLKPLEAGKYCLQILQGTFDGDYGYSYACPSKNQFINNRITNVGSTQQIISALDTTVIGLPISAGQIVQTDVTNTGSPYYIFEVR